MGCRCTDSLPSSSSVQGEVRSLTVESCSAARRLAHQQHLHGFLFLDKARFRASFAADVDEAKAEFMAASQVPWGIEALDGKIAQPAWKTRPSWYGSRPTTA
jgi:hypothetical protein